MRHFYTGAAIGLGLLAFSATGALAQSADDNGPDSVVVQTNGESPNSGQQGGNNQLNNADQGIAGDNSNIVLSAEDAALDGVNAQAPDAIAVGGDYDNSSTSTIGVTWVAPFADMAGGSIYDVNDDLVMSENGVAVDGGAAVIEGGVAFGAFSLIEEETALVGGNGVALNAGDTIADDGSALVVGDGNITATAEDDAAVVGGTGSALYVDEADDWTVFGGENKVSMAELDQEVEMDDGGPVLSAGAWTPEETPGTFDPDERQSNPSVTTGDIGLAGSGISINGMSGLNAFNVNTGAMNQGGIHTVAASVGTLTMN